MEMQSATCYLVVTDYALRMLITHCCQSALLKITTVILAILSTCAGYLWLSLRFTPSSREQYPGQPYQNFSSGAAFPLPLSSGRWEVEGEALDSAGEPQTHQGLDSSPLPSCSFLDQSSLAKHSPRFQQRPYTLRTSVCSMHPRSTTSASQLHSAHLPGAASAVSIALPSIAGVPTAEAQAVGSILSTM